MASALSNNMIARAPSAPAAPAAGYNNSLGGDGNMGLQSQPNSRPTNALMQAANGVRAADFSGGLTFGGGQTVGPGALGGLYGPPAAPAPPPDPRDATYWSQIAEINHNRAIGLSALEEAETYAGTGYQRNLSNYERLDPIEARELRQGANVAGGIYSTSTRENEGNLAKEQYNRRAGLGEEYARGQGERAREKGNLAFEYGTGLEENGQINYGQQGNNAYNETILRRINNG